MIKTYFRFASETLKIEELPFSKDFPRVPGETNEPNKKGLARPQALELVNAWNCHSVDAEFVYWIETSRQ